MKQIESVRLAAAAIVGVGDGKGPVHVHDHQAGEAAEAIEGGYFGRS